MIIRVGIKEAIRGEHKVAIRVMRERQFVFCLMVIRVKFSGAFCVIRVAGTSRVDSAFHVSRAFI